MAFSRVKQRIWAEASHPRNVLSAAVAFRAGMRDAALLPAASPTVAAPAPAPARLERYFDAVTEGPGIWKWRHYFPIYERHLSKFVGTEFTLVEVGIYSGGSLAMWREYFGDGCRVVGVDIAEECRAYAGDGVEVLIGDQADPKFWTALRRSVPRVDVLIDDGGHGADQQRTTLREMLGHLQPGGVYLCEDIHGRWQAFHFYVDGLSRPLHDVWLTDGDPQPLHQHVGSVHRYPLLTVIEKPSSRVDAFHAPKHGTQWQPFLDGLPSDGRSPDSQAEPAALASAVRRAKVAARWLLPAPLYQLYRRRLVARAVARYPRRQVTHTYGATTLTIVIADTLAEAWYDHDSPQLPELERLRDHGLVPGARVFDIGAHQGVVALILADAVGPAGRVVAVEPEPHNVRVAERNRELNGADNLEIVHAAGAARAGSVLVAESLNGVVTDGGSRWGKIEVAAVTVDDLAKRHGPPDVVLVDVEGFEGEVLSGASRTIAERRATFLVEVHVGHGLHRPAGEILACFDSSYRLLVAPAWGDTDRFVAAEDAADTMADRFFLIAAPDHGDALRPRRRQP